MIQGNTCESLINVVTENKPKMLTGLDQKVGGQVQVFLTHLTQTTRPPAERRALTHSGTHTKRGKPVVLPTRESSLWDGKANRKESLRGCGYGRVEQAKAAL